MRKRKAKTAKTTTLRNNFVEGTRPKLKTLAFINSTQKHNKAFKKQFNKNDKGL
jgi:hypothetical protein